MPLVHHELCFGCGRANPFGLLLEVESAGPGAVAGRWLIKQDHQGAERGSAHDGIVAAALGEAMALACGEPVHARSIAIRYEDPAPVGTFVEVEASSQHTGQGTIEVTASASIQQRPLATAEGRFERVM